LNGVSGFNGKDTAPSSFLIELFTLSFPALSPMRLEPVFEPHSSLLPLSAPVATESVRRGWTPAGLSSILQPDIWCTDTDGACSPFPPFHRLPSQLPMLCRGRPGAGVYVPHCRGRMQASRKTPRRHAGPTGPICRPGFALRRIPARRPFISVPPPLPRSLGSVWAQSCPLLGPHV